MPHVLAIHAHPDDIEFLAAGTLALLTRKGWSVDIVTLTPGDCGSADRDPDDIAAIRRVEAAASAAIAGAAYRCVEERDLCVYVDDPTQRRVTEAVRVSRPDVVITASPQDYMADHEAASSLVRTACFCAPMRNYKTEADNPAPILENIPALYYADPLEGTNMFGEPIRPHLYVDITETFETKRKMLACHESQRAWLLAHHGVDEYLLAMDRWSKQRGSEVGVVYAEAFRQHRGHAYPHHDVLSEALAESVCVP